MQLEQYRAVSGNGYWLEKYPKLEEEKILPQSYYLFRDRWGHRIPYHMYWNTNHAIFIGGISRWGKTFTTNQICKGEIARGAYIIYDNFKGEPLPFKSLKIDLNKAPLDVSGLMPGDWENITNLDQNAVYDLRQTIKGMTEEDKEITIPNLENELKRRATKSTRSKILNVIEDLQEDEIISEDGLNILKLLNSNRVIELDSSKNPSLRTFIIPHICRVIVRAKMSGVLPKEQKIVMVFDEIADPDSGVGRSQIKRSIGAPIKQVFTLGGVYNLLAIANTQLPQDTNSQIIGNCTDKIIHRLTNENAIKKLAQTTNLDYPTLKRILPYFEKGECLYLRGETQQLRKVQEVP